MAGWPKSMMRRIKKLLLVEDTPAKGKNPASPAAREKLAASPRTDERTLTKLANDSHEHVRMAVAKNPSTPAKTRAAMCEDPAADIRLVLAQRMVELLPGLSEDEHSELYAFAVQALGALAHDEVVKVRSALSGALKDYAQTPPKIAGTLARDIEREVSEPILRYCVALSDEDMLDILSHHPEPWVISAIAGRDHVSEDVSHGVFETEDKAANKTLLENTGAEIAEHTLVRMVEKAQEFPEWQEPLARHGRLSADMGKDLANIAEDAVLRLLEERKDFDETARSDIAEITARRLTFKAGKDSNTDKEGKKPAANQKTKKQNGKKPPDKNGEKAPDNPVAERVRELLLHDKLDDAAISDAIALGERDFIIYALSGLGRVPPAMVEHILSTHSPKAVISLFWLAGLSMRNALAMQKSMKQIDPRDVVNARDGLYYPYSDEDMIWQLEFFGINNPKPRENTARTAETG